MTKEQEHSAICSFASWFSTSPKSESAELLQVDTNSMSTDLVYRARGFWRKYHLSQAHSDISLFADAIKEDLHTYNQPHLAHDWVLACNVCLLWEHTWKARDKQMPCVEYRPTSTSLYQWNYHHHIPCDMSTAVQGLSSSTQRTCAVTVSLNSISDAISIQDQSIVGTTTSPKPILEYLQVQDIDIASAYSYYRTCISLCAI